MDTENNQNVVQTEQTEEVSGKKPKKKDIPKSEEEIYVESLSKKERKIYEKRKKALRRSQWLSEYWIIILLSVALLVVACVLVIINQVRGFNSSGDEVSHVVNAAAKSLTLLVK